MNVIIAGAGDLGFHLAKLLALEEHDIVLIDNDQGILNHAVTHLDVLSISGSSTSIKILERAQIEKTDLVIAVTADDETNLLTAMMGKKLGGKKTIARIENLEFLRNKDKLDLKDLGVDELVSPELLAAREIDRLIKQNVLTDTFEFERGKLSLVGIIIDETSKLLNKTLLESAHLNPDHDFTTVALLRGDETIIPHSEDKFLLNDHAYFISEIGGIEKIMTLTGRKSYDLDNIIILGGGKLAVKTARLLSAKHRIKLVEKDEDKCIKLVDEIPEVIIIHGDGRDTELLRDEGLDRMDAMIALTGNSETNIISCLNAKNCGVKKTIAAVENMDYIHLSQNIGVDTLINKKLIAASFIFKYIRRGTVINLTSVDGLDAEILEFEVTDKSKILKDQLCALNFPKTAIIGGVIRKGMGHTVRGDFYFQIKDRVVVLTRKDCVSKVERFFH